MLAWLGSHQQERRNPHEVPSLTRAESGFLSPRRSVGHRRSARHECCDRAALEQDCIIGVRISLKAINSELERRGSQAVLAKGDGYFYFWGGEAADWLDRTVRVPTLHSLTLDQWIGEFQKLREEN